MSVNCLKVSIVHLILSNLKQKHDSAKRVIVKANLKVEARRELIIAAALSSRVVFSEADTRNLFLNMTKTNSNKICFGPPKMFTKLLPLML